MAQFINSINNVVVSNKLHELAETSIEVGFNGVLGLPNLDDAAKVQRNLHENLWAAFGDENLRAFERLFEEYGEDEVNRTCVDAPNFEMVLAFLYAKAERRFETASRFEKLAIQFGVVLASSEHAMDCTALKGCEIADEDLPF